MDKKDIDIINNIFDIDKKIYNVYDKKERNFPQTESSFILYLGYALS